MPARKNKTAPKSAAPAAKRPRLASDASDATAVTSAASAVTSDATAAGSNNNAESSAVPSRQRLSRDLIRINKAAMAEFVKNAPAMAERFELALAKRRDTAEQERLAADAKRLVAEQEQVAATARCQAWMAREALLRTRLVALAEKSNALRYEATLRGQASANALEHTIDSHLGSAFSDPVEFVDLPPAFYPTDDFAGGNHPPGFTNALAGAI